jgi:hypothetical protein
MALPSLGGVTKKKQGIIYIGLSAPATKLKPRVRKLALAPDFCHMTSLT